MNQTCATCSTVNRPAARFCKKCGKRLSENNADQLDSLIGMEDVKKVFTELTTVMAAVKKDGLSYSDRLHTILMGNTGTGKTKLVNALAALYHKYGVVKQDIPVICDAVDFADFSKNFLDNYKKAKGNILCIENVQKLIPTTYSQGVEQLDRVFREMSKHENRLDPIIILSGQPNGFREYLNANDSVKSKFRWVFNLPDLDSMQLTQMTDSELSKYGFKLPEDALDKLIKLFKYILKQSRMPDYEHEAKNAWLALKMAENIKNNYYLRVTNTGPGERIISIDDVKGDVDKEKPLAQILAEIDAFVGMHGIKKSVRNLIDEIGVQKERVASGLGNARGIAFHIVLTGNPGTGKTTVARKLGEIFKAIGVLELGHVIEVDRSKMVGQFVGQTAPQVHDLCDRAMGGILFIDEAYTLKQNDNDTFGREAIDALLKRMEDDRGKFIVVIAGYPAEITTFLNANPGLQSRFDERYRFHFDDYTPDELLAIFQKIAAEENYSLDEATMEMVKKEFTLRCSHKDKNFGNGREARNLFESCRALHAQRLASLRHEVGFDKAELTCLRASDVPVKQSGGKDLDTALKDIDILIGLNIVKKEVRSLISYLQVEKVRADHGGKTTLLNVHFVFRGNPGTGKTTVARIIAEIFRAMGLLSKGHLIEVDRAGLVAQYIGQTAPKTNGVIDTAMGGVLFIDEAYTLSTDSYGKEAIDTLLKRMEDDKGKFIVIAAGYFKEMADFLNSNSGLMSRFTKFIDFEDYKTDELMAIYKFMVGNKGMILNEDAELKLGILLRAIYENRDKTFANGRTVRNIFEQSLQNQSTRIGPLVMAGRINPDILNTVMAEDIPRTKHEPKDIGMALQELEDLIGLAAVKKEVNALISYLQVEKKRAEQGGKTTPLALHFVFRGNPGTGKTTVARIVANIFNAIGLLSKGHLVEVDRAGLVAQYLGQTAPKTNSVIDTAMGGVLFIDEAYSLAGDNFGKEAINTLLKRMEDDRGKFIAIAAGYYGEMNDFLNSNSGLPSRFNTYIDFEDYNPAEMVAIYKSMVSKKGMCLDLPADQRLVNVIQNVYDNKDINFANGRTVRNLFEKTLKRQSSRIAPLDDVEPDIVNTIIAADIPDRS